MKQRGNPVGLPRISNIEVAKKNLPLRITLLALALVIAFGAFAYGISSLLTTKPGWTDIKSTSASLNCSEDFVLSYNLGAGEMSATAENKQLTALYTKATEDAYQIFNNEYASDELHNIHYVNTHFNEEITVESALYKALSAIAKADNRNIYLAPAYAQYGQLFVCENDVEAMQYDPQRQDETKAYIAEVVKFANDPQMISIEILGNQKICLNVAQEYLEFIAANEIAYVLDFSWMVNAFIADYIADVLLENGFSNGYLSSYDGFTRNLLKTEDKFTLNVYHRTGREVTLPAAMTYTGSCSIVSLRDFPLSNSDRWHYYAFEDGRIASLMLDPADGAEKSAVASLISYSQTASCADILLSIAPLFVADSLDAQRLNALAEDEIYTVYPGLDAVYTNDGSLNISLFGDYSRKTIE